MHTADLVYFYHAPLYIVDWVFSDTQEAQMPKLDVLLLKYIPATPFVK